MENCVVRKSRKSFAQHDLCLGPKFKSGLSPKSGLKCIEQCTPGSHANRLIMIWIRQGFAMLFASYEWIKLKPTIVSVMTVELTSLHFIEYITKSKGSNWEGGCYCKTKIWKEFG